jgi:glycyl-tRNA synthetase beta chain
MVGEFPELQGLMGGYYARAEGFSDAVADAIRDHYKPVGQGDDVPTAPATVAVGLADKLDTIVSFFGINEKPTGSKDPFALRRSALGVIATLLGANIRANLVPVVKQAAENLPFAAFERLAEHPGGRSGGIAALAQDVLDFFADRLKVQQREAGVRHDLIDAVFALGGEDDLVRLLARVKALQAFVETDDGANLLAGYRRAANILKAEAKKGTEPKAFEGFSYEPDAAEGELAQMLDTQLPVAEQAIAREQFEEAMTALSVIRPTIDRFFDDVTVNSQDETKRETRLALLDKLRAAMQKVADFSKIEG